MTTSTVSASLVSIASLEAQVAELTAKLTAANEYIEQLETSNQELQAQVTQLSINPNFGCMTRVAGLIDAEKKVKEEVRKNPNSPISLVTVDIGGMGLSNSGRGEVATNEAMTALLEEIRFSFRSGDIRLLSDGQLNSGDEFLFWIAANPEDLPGIVGRLDAASRKHGFDGAYCGCVQVVGTPNIDVLVDLANEGMEQVYPAKKAKKAAKALLAKKVLESLGDAASVGFAF